MADEAIHRINMLNDIQPDRPCMIYYVPGATHAPHQPTKEWVDKISAMHLFDDGYQAVRQQIFETQKMLSVIPKDAKLTAWNDDVPKWDTLPAEAKKLYIRQADVYAAYLAYTDHEIGRVIQAIDDIGKLDNTLVIYIAGDNGASPEGTLNGLYNEFAVANGVHPTVEQNMQFYDEWGSDQTYPHYAVGWALTLDTPYQWTKLRDMQQRWIMEAEKYGVFPLDDSTLPRFIGQKPTYTPDRTEYIYTGRLMNVPFADTGSAPFLLNRSYTITAEIEVPEGGAEGMLMTDGGRFAGYGFYLLKGAPTFTWNMIQLERVKWQGKDPLKPGKHTIVFDWRYDGPGLGKGSTGTLTIDGQTMDSS